MTINKQIQWLRDRVTEMERYQEFSELHDYLSAILKTMTAVQDNLTTTNSECVIVSMPMEAFKRFSQHEDQVLVKQSSVANLSKGKRRTTLKIQPLAKR